MCVPSPLSSTLASGDFPSSPFFTIVFVSDPSGFVIMIVCVPSPLSTTSAVGDFPSFPGSPGFPASPFSPSLMIVVVVVPSGFVIVTV